MTRSELTASADSGLPATGAWWYHYLVLCAGYAALASGHLIWAAGAVTATLWETHPIRVGQRFAILGLCVMLLAGLSLFYRSRIRTARALYAASSITIIVIGGLILASRFLFQSAASADLPASAPWALTDLFVLHFLACAVLPMTWKESIPPFILPWMAWAAVMLGPQTDVDQFTRAITALLSVGAFIPGWLLAIWRSHRHEETEERRQLGRQVETMGGELSRARIVHDAMFPSEFDLGHVKFEYEYHPIAEIGGDYVHLCMTDRAIYLTLLDVAGHGLAAALTVNRLFGELERIRAENPHADPAEVMGLLNRYINLTMARHSLYATGACMMLDTTNGELKWVNAGHPPGFVRRGDGKLESLDGTCMLLGALSHDDFDPSQQVIRLQPGDTVVAYTDGVFEARNADGKQFGLQALRETMCFDTPPRSWPKFIAQAVANHHRGYVDDDVLIASLTLRGFQIAGTPRKPSGVGPGVRA